MKLQRLAGFGPAAAFVSAASVVAFAVLQQVGADVPASLLVAAIAVFLGLMALNVAALTVTVFDLEWLDHPATSKPRIQFALWATVVATFMPAVLGLIQFAGLPVNFAVPYTVYFLGIGISVLVHSIEGRRAGLMHGALAWIGIVDGALFIALAALQALVMVTFALVMGAFYLLPVCYLLYVVWAIWLGAHLIRSRAHTTIRATTAVAAN